MHAGGFLSIMKPYDLRHAGQKNTFTFLLLYWQIMPNLKLCFYGKFSGVRKVHCARPVRAHVAVMLI